MTSLRFLFGTPLTYHSAYIWEQIALEDYQLVVLDPHRLHHALDGL